MNVHLLHYTIIMNDNEIQFVLKQDVLSIDGKIGDVIINVDNYTAGVYFFECKVTFERKRIINDSVKLTVHAGFPFFHVILYSK